MMVYILHPSENFGYADDSVHYVTNIKNGGAIRAHHLVLAMLPTVFRPVLGPDPSYPRTLMMMRLYVAVGGGLGILVIGVLLLRWCASTFAALSGMLLVGLSYGYWAYSVLTDLYVPAIAFALTAIWLADKACSEARTGRVLVVLLLCIVAVLLAAVNHQLQALVAIPITLGILFSRRHGKGTWESVGRAAYFFVIVSCAGLAIFYTFFKLDPSDDFLLFVRGMSAYMDRPMQDHLQLLTPVYAFVGFVRVLIYPEYLLGFDKLFSVVQGQFPVKFLEDERFLLRDMGDVSLSFLTVLNVFIVALSLFYLIAGIRAFRRSRMSPGQWMAVGWTCVMTIASVMWEPTSNEFWIWAMPALSILITPFALGGSVGAGKWVAVLALICSMLIANGTVLWKYGSASNCIYRENKRYLGYLTADDLAIEAGFQNSKAAESLVETPAQRYESIFGAFSMADSSLIDRLDTVARSGGRVVLDPMLVMPSMAENNYMEFALGKGKRAEVQGALRDLEHYCEENGIELIGLVRIGAEELRVDRRDFNGYIRLVTVDELSS